jgi:hypothetical protein
MEKDVIYARRRHVWMYDPNRRDLASVVIYDKNVTYGFSQNGRGRPSRKRASPVS